MYSTVNSGSTENTSDQLSQISALQDRLDSSEINDCHTNTLQISHVQQESKPAIFFFSFFFFNENLSSRRPIVSPLDRSGYNIIPPGTISKNLVLSQSQIYVRIVHVSRKKKQQLQFP